MWRGSVYGTALGVLAASTALLAAFVIQELLRGMGSPGNLLSGAPLLLLLVAAVAGPGALLGSVPLQLLLRRRRERSADRGTLLVLALTLGLGFGFLNLAATLAVLLGPSRALDFLSRDAAWFRLVPAAAAGGLGLGLGCFWGLPKREEAP
jgi:hypothetical protein